MRILLVAATLMEIEPVLQQMPELDHLVSGVGCPESIYHITKRLQQLDYGLLIQAGIAGSFTTELDLGEVVMVKEDRFADLGVFEKNKFKSVFDMQLSDENRFPYTNGWMPADNVHIDAFPYKKVRSITVNAITDELHRIKLMIEKFSPEIETMEGAALHYVCMQEKVPFIQLRSISNYVGERDKGKWEMEQALKQLNSALLVMLDTFAALPSSEL